MNPLKLLITVALGIAPISAQQKPTEVTEFKIPGDALHYEIKFEGPDAAKVRKVSIYFTITGQPHSDQVGFSNQFGSDQFAASSPDTFAVDLTIPLNAASGDYRMTVSVQAQSGGASYAAGEQFQIPLLRVRSDKTFTPPHITVTQLKER